MSVHTTAVRGRCTRISTRGRASAASRRRFQLYSDVRPPPTEPPVRLLTGFEIENFRSIRRLRVEELDSYAPIIGLNSSGKSNILRALNLFFNGHLDEVRTPLELERDYPDSLRKSGKRQRVAVAVRFNTSAVQPRGAEQYLKSSGFAESLVIQREWTRAPQTGLLVDAYRVGATFAALQPVPDTDVQNVLSFIRAIHYRYVPNHVRPADLIRDEIQVLRPSLVTNLSRTKEFQEGGVTRALEALSRVATAMLQKTSDSIAAGSGRQVAVDVPANFADLAFQVALQTVTAGGLQPTELQGSGTQSFTLLHVLDLLDRAQRGRGFGWTKGNIWAIEEPESFLHAGLRARFAQDLFHYADDDKRQVLATTHADEFVRVAERAHVATLKDSSTESTVLDARDALAATTRLRVTTFQHPLMYEVDEALVLVEGKFDEIHLKAALQEIGLRPRWRLASLALLDPDSGAGGSGVEQYLRINRLVLKSRPRGAPVFVLRDWEDQSLAKLEQVVAAHDTSKILRCPEVLANPDLDQTFVGIERYLPTDLIRSKVPSQGLGRPTVGDLPLSLRVGRQKYEAYKKVMAEAVAAGAKAGPHMGELVRWLDREVLAVLDGVPVQEFLS